jgi:anti-sigma factor RsiW
MNCREFYSFLDDFLEGSLDSAIAEAFARHIQQCPPCLVYLDTYRTTIRVLAEAEWADEPLDAAVPSDLINAILASRPFA